MLKTSKGKYLRRLKYKSSYDILWISRSPYRLFSPWCIYLSSTPNQALCFFSKNLDLFYKFYVGDSLHTLCANSISACNLTFTHPPFHPQINVNVFSPYSNAPASSRPVASLTSPAASLTRLLLASDWCYLFFPRLFMKSDYCRS